MAGQRPAKLPTACMPPSKDLHSGCTGLAWPALDQEFRKASCIPSSFNCIANCIVALLEIEAIDGEIESWKAADTRQGQFHRDTKRVMPR